MFAQLASIKTHAVSGLVSKPHGCFTGCKWQQLSFSSQDSVEQDAVEPVLQHTKYFALYLFVMWHVLPFAIPFVCLFTFVIPSR